MRKRVFLTILIGVLWCLQGATTPSYARSTGSLEGEEFVVFMWCDDDAGDYCDESDIVMEEFVFEDDDAFYLGTFEDQGIGTGSYNEELIFFEAEFSAVEDVIESYEFDISGLNIFESLILGVAEVSYKYLIILDDEDANCYFIGFPK